MKWLLDEMLPPACAEELKNRGHDAVSVLELGMMGMADAAVFERAVREARVVVTENFADFARLVARAQRSDEACVPVVFVRRENLPKRGALAVHLAMLLDAWAADNPELFVGLHWP